MTFRLIVFVMFIAAGVGVSAAQTAIDSKKVLDYFEMIQKKSNYFHQSVLGENDTKIEVNDTRNGFLRITGAFEGWIEVALFRNPDNSPVLLVGLNTCGPACGTDLFAYRLKDDDFVLSNESVLPKLDEEEVVAKYRRNVNDKDAEIISYLYQLPREGRKVKISEDVSGDMIFEMEWLGDRFVVNRSILDYYYIWPGTTHTEAKESTEFLIKDEKNGFVRTKAAGAVVEYALFRRTDGSAIMVRAENYCGTGRCATAEISVHEYADSGWKDITNKVFPDQTELENRVHTKSPFARKRGYQYKLPQFGTTIKIVEGSDGKSIYELVWKNDQFVVM